MRSDTIRVIRRFAKEWQFRGRVLCFAVNPIEAGDQLRGLAGGRMRFLRIKTVGIDGIPEVFSEKTCVALSL